MALVSSAGFLGQAQVAPDSAGAPGTQAALSETTGWTLTPKLNTPDASVFVAEGMGTVMATRDPEPSINGIYDFGDGGLTNIIQSVFPSIIGSPFVPQTRVWPLLLESSTASTLASAYVSELTFDTSDPNALTKFTAKFGFDGTPTTPYTTATTSSVIAPTTSLNPGVAYKASVSINLVGVSTAFTTTTLTQIGATNSYQIPTGKRALDVTVALVLGGGATAGNSYTVDAFFGVVTPTTPYTAAPTVVSGSWWPMTKLIGVTKCTTTMTFNLDASVTDINQAGYVKRAPTTRDVKMSLMVVGLATSIPQQSGGSNIGAVTWRALWENRQLILVEHDPDGQQQRVFRGWFYIDQIPESLTVDKVVQQSISLKGANQTLRGAVGNSGSGKLVYAGFSCGAV
jgi:hypothetical protein